MTHEACADEPEGGLLGETWLDDAADVEPEPLPNTPIGDLR